MIESLLLLINLSRQTPLYVDPVLMERAQTRAEYLCAHAQWSHEGWTSSFAGMGGYVGENLATGFSDATSTHQAFMASPTHRANILNPRYSHVGIGEACGIHVELFRS